MATGNNSAGASLEDRITMPEHKDIPTIATTGDSSTNQASASGMNATAASFAPGHNTSWADDVNSPVDANTTAVEDGKTKAEESETKAEESETKAEESGTKTEESETKAEESDLSKAQVDGATESQNGSSAIYEPTYDVDVKLSDVQADPNNPLYSIKSFDELGL